MPNLLPGLIITLIWSGSFGLASIPYFFLSELGKLYSFAGVMLIPVVFIFSFITIAGVLSRFAQKGIIKGKFPRELTHPVYILRRIYGACWTQVFYFKPIYSVALTIPILKSYMFRLFGYKAPSTQFVVYPDSWIRDLPCLWVGKGAYVANRSTIGTNICLSDGTIYVDRVKIEDKAMVGHLSIIGPGAKLRESCEIGIRATVGIKCVVGKSAKIFAESGLNHGTLIGKNSEIGTRSFLGLKVEIGDNIKVPAGSSIPAGTIIRTQDECDKLIIKDRHTLETFKEELLDLIAKQNGAA
jgi:carbonic anhydrase/acetyltransferase-like protein (isoleucine patch superfamily)